MLTGIPHVYSASMVPSDDFCDIKLVSFLELTNATLRLLETIDHAGLEVGLAVRGTPSEFCEIASTIVRTR